MATSVQHPYFPRTLQIETFVPQTWTAAQILGIFFAAVTALLVFGYAAFALTDAGRASKANKSLATPLATRLVFLWFLLCGCIHTFVEGYFVYNHKSFMGGSFFLDDLWKEYALSDSRYAFGDPTVVLIEFITCVFWGPLSFVAAYLIWSGNPARHVVQLIVSFGQLYGDILYYFTTLVEGAPHCHPHPFYFWIYFVLMNAFWIVFPAMVIAGSSSAMMRSLTLAHDLENVAAAKKSKHAQRKDAANKEE